MAAGSLFRDEDGRVLLVDPTYKPTWDLPGGAVEKEESPHAACRREVAEELGLDRVPGRVLVVDWVPSRPERPEGLIVVYDGGVLAPGDVAAITLPDAELAGYEFVQPGEVAGRSATSAWVRPAFLRISVRYESGTNRGRPGGWIVKTAEGAFWSELVLDRGALGRYRLDELPDDLPVLRVVPVDLVSLEVVEVGHHGKLEVPLD